MSAIGWMQERLVYKEKVSIKLDLEGIRCNGVCKKGEEARRVVMNTKVGVGRR
jgi:hypothetical protein